MSTAKSSKKAKPRPCSAITSLDLTSPQRRKGLMRSFRLCGEFLLSLPSPRLENGANQIRFLFVPLQVRVLLSAGIFELECLEVVRVFQQKLQFPLAVARGSHGLA